MTILAIVLLLVLSLAGLAMIPLGLPGLWVMVAAILAYGWLTGFHSVGVVTIGLVLALALLGGLVGAVIGVPVAIIGSVIGAFIGSFVGAALFEYTYSRHAGVATRAGWGAIVGRAAGAAVKIALGVVIAVVAGFAVLSYAP